MKSKLALNLLLVAAILGLAAVLYFEPGKDEDGREPLTKVDEANLNRIALTNKDTIVFEKKDGRWRLTAPFQAPVNEIRVRQLVDIAKAPVEASYPLKAENLAKFELDKPKASLALGNTTLVFGGSDPINMRRYVQLGETLYLVNDDFFHHLQAIATDYVDKKLLPEGAKVTGIDMPGLKASLGAGGKWTREPAGVKPDLSELATLWATSRAIDVRRLDKEAKGDPVRVTLTEGDPVQFVVLQRDPELILARPDLGLQFELTGESARQLLNLPKASQTPAPTEPPPGPDEATPADDEDEGPPPVEGEDDGGAPVPAGPGEEAGPPPALEGGPPRNRGDGDDGGDGAEAE